MKIYTHEECIKTNIKLKIRFLKLILLFLRSLSNLEQCPIWVRSPLLHLRRTIHRHQQRRRFKRSSERNASLPSRHCPENGMHHHPTRTEIRETGTNRLRFRCGMPLIQT